MLDRKNPWRGGVVGAERITTIPSNFKVHPLVEKVIADRAAMGRGEINVDWGMGEHLAYASLVASGYAVRLSGEDCGRGTFTHRHAVLHDQNREKWDEGTYTPLCNVAENQAPFVVIDSLLSEEGVVGFEYGYSTTEPETLVIWEAQFGDFANNAQVIIDQFIAGGESKWDRSSGLVLFLPHGYEGQGPEHSSARLERYLQLSAEDNWAVCNITTPANYFHVLRRQMVRQFRKPLIIFTPKSLLRAKDATSPLAEFTKGEFRTVIGEVDAAIQGDKVKRVIACSGKVAYDLIRKRDEKKAWDVAIVRVGPLAGAGLDHRRQRRRFIDGPAGAEALRARRERAGEGGEAEGRRRARLPPRAGRRREARCCADSSCCCSAHMWAYVAPAASSSRWLPRSTISP